MKKKTSHILLTALVALALLIVVVLAVVRPFDAAGVDPHAGHDHSSDPHTTAPHTTRTTNNKKPSESYTLTENKDGTYSFEVKNIMGGVMYSDKNLTEKPQFTQVDDNVLCVSGKASKNNLSGWAVFCNIRSMEVYQQESHVLATVDNQVAYLDRRDGKWIVFVHTVFDTSVGLKSTELPDLAIQETGHPEISCKVTKSGDLKVTYATTDGENKTVTVTLE